MIINDQCFVVSKDEDLIPVVLFKGGGSYMGVFFWALALLTPLDIIVLDNYNMSILRQEVVRAIPVAVKARKSFSQI